MYTLLHHEVAYTFPHTHWLVKSKVHKAEVVVTNRKNKQGTKTILSHLPQLGEVCFTKDLGLQLLTIYTAYSMPNSDLSLLFWCVVEVLTVHYVWSLQKYLLLCQASAEHCFPHFRTLTDHGAECKKIARPSPGITQKHVIKIYSSCNLRKSPADFLGLQIFTTSLSTSLSIHTQNMYAYTHTHLTTWSCLQLDNIYLLGHLRVHSVTCYTYTHTHTLPYRHSHPPIQTKIYLHRYIYIYL